MDARIQNYMRFAASFWRETQKVGPFLATFHRHSENPYLNYAIPDQGAEPSDEEVAALVSAFERRGLKPRLEYLPSQAPLAETALLASGFRAEGRLALMTCTRESFRSLPVPPGIEIVVPVSDSDFAGIVLVTKQSYEAEAAPPTQAEVDGRRALIGAGGFAVLARDRETGEPAGSGICEVRHGGVTELATVGVRPQFRRRGIAAAVTARLAGEAFAAGVSLIWLTPLGDEGERIYSRVGFVTGSEVLHISR
jgi:ribosomal protein S18 acetylase RimI-like enzyme